MLPFIVCAALINQTPDLTMHRAWSIITYSDPTVVQLDENSFAYGSANVVGIADIKTGQPKWQQKVYWGQSFSVSRKKLFVSFNSEESQEIHAFDKADGKQEIIFKPNLEIIDTCADADNLFILLKSSQVIRLNAETGEVIWTAHIDESYDDKGITLGTISEDADALYVGLETLGHVCISKSDGQERWRNKTEYGSYNAPAFLPQGVLWEGGGVVMHDRKTGRKLWEIEGIEQFGQIGSTLIAEYQNEYIGIDTNTGKSLWTIADAPEGFSTSSDLGLSANMSDKDTVWFTQWNQEESQVLGISSDGKVTWEQPVKFSGSLTLRSGSHYLTTTPEMIYGYQPGSAPAWPASPDDQMTQAENWVKNWEHLDAFEKLKVLEFLQHVHKPLLDKIVHWGAEYHRQNVADDQDYENGTKLSENLSFYYYSLMSDDIMFFANMSNTSNAEATMEAWAGMDDDNLARDYLRQIINRDAPELIVPALVKKLRTMTGEESEFYFSSNSLSDIANSSHPDAVAFMVETLEDPEANPSWRHEAFINLPRTAGDQGVALIKKWRATSVTKEIPWYDKIDVENLTEHQLFGTETDDKGRTWRLFRTYLLGHSGDLCISQKTEDGWSKPVWIGTFYGGTFNNGETTEYRGVPIDDLVKTEWIKLFPDDQSIRKDTDNDGLTDLVEARFETDPNKADTDSDGKPDATDPTPAAKPGDPLTDAQKIIAATIEARFFPIGDMPPSLVTAPGENPFEVVTYGGQVFWQQGEPPHSMRTVYGAGVHLLRFSHPRREEGSFIVYSEDKQTAAVDFSRYSGGLNGEGYRVTLTKVEGEWYVIQMQMLFIS